MNSQTPPSATPSRVAAVGSRANYSGANVSERASRYRFIDREKRERVFILSQMLIGKKGSENAELTCDEWQC